ncbi:MAG: hypothetical protein IT500_16855 [Rubrivivax sp.]|nr:hypothetical protein [Rubrivivax sp.]
MLPKAAPIDAGSRSGWADLDEVIETLEAAGTPATRRFAAGLRAYSAGPGGSDLVALLRLKVRRGGRYDRPQAAAQRRAMVADLVDLAAPLPGGVSAKAKALSDSLRAPRDARVHAFVEKHPGVPTSPAQLVRILRSQ